MGFPKVIHFLALLPKKSKLIHFGRISPLFLAFDAAHSFTAYWFVVQYPDLTWKFVGDALIDQHR